MIAYLAGTVLAKTATSIIVVTENVGYEITVPVSLWRRAVEGAPITLFTHEYQREDRRDLYGFASLNERAFFEKLISISGVGPKIAITVLSLGTAGEIETAIATGNVSYLTAIPGVGQKTAQKIVLELKGKLDLTTGDGDRETIEALESLGYSSTQAQDALRRVSPEITDVGERLRAALRLMGQRVR